MVVLLIAKYLSLAGSDSEDEDYVLLRVPKDILKLTVPAAVRRGLSHGAHVTLLASFILNSGGDVDDFTLSYSSSHRVRKEALGEIYAETRENFVEKVTTNDWVLTLHFDEAEVEDTIGPERSRVVQKRKRLAVTLTTPCLADPVFVGAQIVEDGTGAECADKAVEAVENLGVMDHIWNLDYDTTASNSSPTVGAAALIEQHRGVQVLKSPCRRHIWDLFGKNLSTVVSGQRSTGPAYPLFQRYFREWPQICNIIDYNNLSRFDMRPWFRGV